MAADVVTLSSDSLTARISPLGAELRYFSDGAGRELLWNGDPEVWRGRAPILFPVIGLLEGGCYRLKGISCPMPKHGFARQSAFDVLGQSADAATFRLAASDETRAIYPFEFQLDISFRVISASLEMAATIANHGTTSMPVSFGFHPAFRWPLPFGQPRDAHQIVFQHDEPAPIRRIDAQGLLIAAPQPTPVEGDTVLLRDDLFEDDAIIFDQLTSQWVRYGAPEGPRLQIDFRDFPTLGVWTKPGAEFICIEPWQGFSDPVGYCGDIRDKPGTIQIPPGTNKRLAMHISLIG